MIELDYRVKAEDEILLDVESVNITFMDWSPVNTNEHILSMYPDFINNKESLSQFDGFFSLSIDPLVEKGQNELTDIYKALLLCEKENKKVSIEVKPHNSEFEDSYAVIFNKCNIFYVSKITRIEKNGEFASMIFMLYKN